MRRPLLASAIALGLAATPALARGAAPQQDAGGSWTTYSVTAAPMPDGVTWRVSPSGAPTWCDGKANAWESTRAFVAPADGRLEVEALPTRGDWDIALVNAEGDWVGGGGFGDGLSYPDATERAGVRLRKGKAVTIGFCNYNSPETTIAARHRFVRDVERPRTPVAGLRHLLPGRLPDLRERVPVNVVLLGYEAEVDAAALRKRLPRKAKPHERMPYFYGLERPLGITYTYDYRVVRTDRAYEDRFFRTLRAMGRDVPPTSYMRSYNASQRNRVDVVDPLEVDAPSVERWLAQHPPRGVDTRNPTVFLINWWGRPDFRFHVYAKTGEPETDHKIDHGAREYMKVVAWGGTPPDDPETGLGDVRRVWFHDLSAGPEYWTRSYQVDDLDRDDDGKEDRRLLPVWEYHRDGVRPPSQLTRDLADLVRYAFVDLMVTPSPLYTLRLRSPAMPRSVDVDTEVFTADAGQTRQRYAASVLQRSTQQLTPLQQITADAQLDRPLDGQHATCLAQYLATARVPAYTYGPSCHPERKYHPYANPYVHYASTLDEHLDDPHADHEVPVAAHALPPDQLTCYAYADDNYRDGTPSMAFAFMGACRSYFGFTDILTHEVGHHLGMSHPHDGYDWEEDLDFGSWGKTELAAAGDEVNSVMSYLFVNNEYSQFDRDNHARWTAAALLAEAAHLVDRVRKGSRRPSLAAADRRAGQAYAHFAGHRYLAAAAAARAAYDEVVRAARSVGIRVDAGDNGTRLSDASPLPRLKRGLYARMHAFDSRPGRHPLCRDTACLTGTPLAPAAGR